MGKRIVFSGGHVFDGTGAAPAQADVTVQDGRFVEVGARLDGDVQVDVTGKTLLPGLFDCHVHVMVSHINVVRHLESPFSYRFYETARSLEAILRTGITTVRDAAGADLGTRTAVERGLVIGPRMKIAITMIGQTGGHSDGWLASGCALELLGGNPGVPKGVVDGPDEMRKKVREVIRAGADWIKIASSGGVVSPRDNPRHPHLRREEIEMAVREAAFADMYVMSHAQATEGIKEAVRCGVRSIEHGIYLDDEAIDLMLQKGTFFCPTLLAPQSVLEAGRAGGISEAGFRKVQEVIEAHKDSYRRAARAGVKVVMGTDAVGYPHGRNLEELELLAMGLPPHEVLKATTLNAAQLLGVDGELGTIEPGKCADLVVLEGDPYQFRAMRERVAAVYKEGKLVPQQPLELIDPAASAPATAAVGTARL